MWESVERPHSDKTYQEMALFLVLMKAILETKEESGVFRAAPNPPAPRTDVFRDSIHKLADRQLPKRRTPRLRI
jgi:hypothetical protein